MRTFLLTLLTVALIACGGSETKTAGPSGGGGGGSEDSGPEDGSADEAMIPSEKFDEIKRTFERKQIQISRCFVAGVDAEEIQKNDRGTVTVSATITRAGKASGVRIVETTFKSPALEKCVKDYVSAWVFSTLPRDLEYSYQYRLERF